MVFSVIPYRQWLSACIQGMYLLINIFSHLPVYWILPSSQEIPSSKAFVWVFMAHLRVDKSR
jgi:hypothetical protein